MFLPVPKVREFLLAQSKKLHSKDLDLLAQRMQADSQADAHWEPPFNLFRKVSQCSYWATCYLTWFLTCNLWRAMHPQGAAEGNALWQVEDHTRDSGLLAGDVLQPSGG